MTRRKINIKDVAARARVHPSTVSRVLNHETRSMVSETVARRVEKVAKSMGYSRSPLASGLRTGRSFTIGVLIPDLTNPVFPPIVRGIERSLSAKGYIAMLADSDNNQDSELMLLESMKSRSVDGMILATAHRKDPVVDACVADKIPLVLVNRTTDSHDVTSVVNDDVHGIDLAISHLLELGHQRIAFVGGPQNTSTGRDRYVAFRNHFKNGDFKSHPDLMINATSFSEAAGEKTLKKLWSTRRKFTAVVAANDLLALGCYDALQTRGMSCPKDLSITGFNDMPFVDKLSPSLTSIRIPLDEIGRQAADLLLSQIRTPADTGKTIITLKPELIIRESTELPGG
jgi:LacI family transcriptional regulator